MRTFRLSLWLVRRKTLEEQAVTGKAKRKREGLQVVGTAEAKEGEMRPCRTVRGCAKGNLKGSSGSVEQGLKCQAGLF